MREVEATRSPVTFHILRTDAGADVEFAGTVIAGRLVNESDVDQDVVTVHALVVDELGRADMTSRSSARTGSPAWGPVRSCPSRCGRAAAGVNPERLRIA
jgi:hypothetical protein